MITSLTDCFLVLFQRWMTISSPVFWGEVSYCTALSSSWFWSLNHSEYAFEVKIAEFSRTPEDFLKKYDELKSKNTRNLDPLVYLLSKLTEDREVCAGLGAGQAEPGGRADGDLPGLCSLLFPGGGPLLTLSLRPMALR